MARKVRRRCRWARGAEKMSGRERCEEDADVARGAETAARVPAAGQKGVEKKGTLFFHNMQ